MKIEWIEKYMSEAEQLIYNNEIEQGLTVLNNLLYDEPGYGSLHNHLGWAYLYYTTDTLKAELHLTAAIRFDGAYAAPYLHLGTLYIRMARYSEALEYLKLGLTKNNAHRMAFLDCIGQAYEMTGEYSKAIKAYKQALLASMVNFEMSTLTESVKRCRKKRLIAFFTR